MKRPLSAALSLTFLFLVLLSSVAVGANYCLDAKNNDLCPDIMHTKHQAFMNDCKGCHNLTNSFIASGVFFNDSSKGAYLSGGPAPVFTPSGNWSFPRTTTPASCSNIACHSIPSGTYTYYIWDWGIDEAVAVTYNYGGMSTARALWQDNPNTNCNSCHAIPPFASNVWHSGSHGNFMIGANNCETCHPDAQSSTSLDGATIISNYITAPSQHGNGNVDVVAKFTSRCFGCH
jgi:hypothetical protein